MIRRDTEQRINKLKDYQIEVYSYTDSREQNTISSKKRKEEDNPRGLMMNCFILIDGEIILTFAIVSHTLPLNLDSIH